MSAARARSESRALTAGPQLNVTWTEGGRRPDRQLARMPGELGLPRTGSLIIGELGNMVLPHVGGPRLYAPPPTGVMNRDWRPRCWRGWQTLRRTKGREGLRESR